MQHAVTGKRKAETLRRERLKDRPAIARGLVAKPSDSTDRMARSGSATRRSRAVFAVISCCPRKSVKKLSVYKSEVEKIKTKMVHNSLVLSTDTLYVIHSVQYS